MDYCDRCGHRVQQRSVEQNAAFHALLADIARQRDWPRGSRRLHGPTFWKQMLVAGWERAHKREAQWYPSVEDDGELDPVFQRRTSRMNRAEMSELIEYASAWAVKEGVRLRVKDAH